MDGVASASPADPENCRIEKENDGVDEDSLEQKRKRGEVRHSFKVGEEKLVRIDDVSSRVGEQEIPETAPTDAGDEVRAESAPGEDEGREQEELTLEDGAPGWFRRETFPGEGDDQGEGSGHADGLGKEGCESEEDSC
jgi:hypothetical protein